MNRKNIFITVLAGMLLSVSGLASAQPYDRYTTFQAALADQDGYDSGVAGMATYGFRVPEFHKNFAIETEFAMTFIEPEGKDRGTTYESSYYSLAGYGVYAHPLSSAFHVRGRIGLAYSNVETSSAVTTGTESGIDLSYGVGITLNMSSETRFILEYTVYDNDADVNHISAGLQFKLK